MTDESIDKTRKCPWWQRYPYVDVFLVAVILCGIGDKFPFTPFPMYKNPDTSADVLFVTDENDQVIHTRTAFDIAASGAKKDFEGFLDRIAKTKDYENAQPEQVKQAGEQMLEKMYGQRVLKSWKKYNPSTLRLKMFTVSFKNGEFKEETHVLAERQVPKEP